MPNLKEMLFGSKAKTEQMAALNPEQLQALSSILGVPTEKLPGIMEQLSGFNIEQQQPFQQGQEALGSLLKGFDPARTQQAFQAGVADPAMRQFREQIAPGIQERFIGAGAGQSSAAQRQLSQAGSDLQSNLSGQLSQQLLSGEQMGQQGQLGALGQGLGYAQAPQQSQLAGLAPLLQSLGLGMGTSPFAYMQTPGTQGAFGALAGGVGQGLGSYLGGKI